jgi:TetR/AcrR family transcriptional repressor of nem operon
MSSVTVAPPAVVRDTASQILDVAERLVQSRGFNDVSYADIAVELGVTKPSLHYHFRSKAALGDALIARYSARFFEQLDRIEADVVGVRARLDAYVGIYAAVLAAGRMCLCGILAAEYQTLPEKMRSAVLDFFDRNEAWLERILDESSRDTAKLIIDTLEGAVMIARAQNDSDRFDRVAERLVSSVVPGVADPR